MSKITFSLLLTIFAFQLSMSQDVIVAIESNNDAEPTATGNVANMSSVGFSRGNGVDLTTSNHPRFTSDNWTESSLNNAQTANDYIEWSVTANSNYNIELTSISISLRSQLHNNGTTGPTEWQLFYSLDNFATPGTSVNSVEALTPDVGENFSYNNLSINSGNTGTITFRLYAWGATNNNRWLRIRAISEWDAFGFTDTVGALISGEVSEFITLAESDIAYSTFGESENIDYTLYSATSALTTSNAIKIAEYEIRDGGSDLSDADLASTTLTDISFDVLGYDNLQALAIFDGDQNLGEITTVGTTASFSSLSLTANDDASKTFDVYATFKSTVTDNDQIKLTISNATADSFGSTFEAVDAGGAESLIDGDINRIEVIATELSFIQQPSDTNVDQAMYPYVVVAAQDENGNIDLDYSEDITLGSTGSLAGSTITITPTEGVATYTNVVHTALADNILLTASGTGLTGTLSNSFSIVNGPVYLAFQSFEGGGTWGYTTTPDPFTSGNTVWNVVDSSFGSFTSMPTEGTYFFGGQNSSDATGTGTILMSTYSVSDYSDVTVSFDYEVIDFDNSDLVQYELFIDNASQGIVDLVVGTNGGGVSQSGTVDLPIIDTAGTVRLNVYVTANNQGDYAAFDYFRIEGTPLPPPVDYTFINGSWSPEDPTGVSTYRDVILVKDGTYEMNEDTTASVMLVSPGAAVTISSGVTFTVINNLGLLSQSNSYSSLILDGTIIGSVSYERHVNTPGGDGGNDLISAPVSGQQFGVFAANNDNIYSNPADPSMKRFGPFNKTTGTYVNLDTDVIEEYQYVLEPGIGYRAASTDGNNFAFSGAVSTGTVLTPIEQAGPAHLEWNLIGNPYPSYLLLSEFLTLNNDLFMDDAAGVYGYDSLGDNSFTVWNLAYSDANPDAIITPGQGFLVASKPAGGNVSFTADMRTTGSSDDFIAGKQTSTINNSYYITLQLSNSNEDSKNTYIYLNDNASLGLDPGYDSAIQGFDAASYDIYSQLVEDNNGIDMAIQSISNNDVYGTTNIPLGINAPQGQQLTVSIAETTFPLGINVYLQDTEMNTFTLLNTTDYVFTTSSNLTSPGRFYITFSNSTLSNIENELSNIEIFNIKAQNKLIVKGDLTNSSYLTIHDIQGRIMMNKTLLTNSNKQEIDLSTLSSGVYVVKLQGKVKEKVQKIIIE